jgi:16S rRNA (uracil1498-N3)-methyltransferase
MERHDHRLQRLFTEADLAADAIAAADRDQTNYLLNVLRLKAGASLLLFNGRDGEWLAEVENASKKACSLRLVRQTRPQTTPNDLWYLFAPLKQARLDYMVQKAVEMGVSTLVPVITQHTQVGRVNQKRMLANAVEAAEQCGVLNLPEIDEAAKLDAVLSRWPEGRHLIFCDEAADGNPIENLRPLRGKPLAVLIGPEGGFSQTERDRLTALPFVATIALGPRILRADTAAVAALAIIQTAAGDWI